MCVFVALICFYFTHAYTRATFQGITPMLCGPSTWVHGRTHLLMEGRTTAWVDPAAEDEEDEDEGDETEKKSEEKEVCCLCACVQRTNG